MGGGHLKQEGIILKRIVMIIADHDKEFQLQTADDIARVKVFKRDWSEKSISFIYTDKPGLWAGVEVKMSNYNTTWGLRYV